MPRWKISYYRGNYWMIVEAPSKEAARKIFKESHPNDRCYIREYREPFIPSGSMYD